MPRLDKLLVELNYFPSREKAHDAITQKTVAINGQIVDKPSKEVENEASIQIIDTFNKYVSRGGLKLEKAITDFNLNFENKSVLDVGSSTGGFTDCALKHGAAHVTAIDVGTNQLHESLLHNTNVLSIENKDFRTLTTQEINPAQYDFIVSDVSFISLTYLMPFFKQFLLPEGQMMLLIKPQFEAGQSFLNKGGIVTDEKGYKVAIQNVTQEATNQGFYINNIAISTLFEKNKNVEFLSLLSMSNNHFKIDYLSLFKNIKTIKKLLK